jgi:hypothetical protein
MLFLGVGLFVLLLAADSGASWIVLTILYVVLAIPAFYIEHSAKKAAEERYKNGDESGFPPAIVRAKKAYEAKQEAKRRDAS